MKMVVVCVMSPAELWEPSTLKMRMGALRGMSGRPNRSVTETSMKAAFAPVSSSAGMV